MQPMNPDLVERLPPQDFDAEKGVLGSVLLDPTVLHNLTDLRPEHFYMGATSPNGRLYRHLCEMQEANQPIDALLLIDRLKASGELEAIGGPAYLAEVAQSVPYAANAGYYAEIVRDKAAWRSVLGICTTGLRQSYLQDGTPTALVSALLEQLQAADAGTEANKPIKAADAAIEALERIDAIQAGRCAAGQMIGIANFDQSIGGLFSGELTVLAARPGEGKTSLACQIAWHFAERGRGVYHVSLEMDARELMQRILCSQAEVSSREIRTGSISAENADKLVEASQPVAGMPWWFHAKMAMGVPDLTREVQRKQRTQPLSLVIVDYLQLLTPTAERGDNREQRVAKMSRQLKALAVECQVSVLLLAQLNRGMPTDKYPSLKMLRESGAIEQDADMVIVPWAYDWKMKDDEDKYAKEAEDSAESSGDQWYPRRRHLYVLKNRNGEQGRFALDWIPARTLFVEHGEAPHAEFAEFGGGK